MEILCEEKHGELGNRSKNVGSNPRYAVFWFCLFSLVSFMSVLRNKFCFFVTGKRQGEGIIPPKKLLLVLCFCYTGKLSSSL